MSQLKKTYGDFLSFTDNLYQKTGKSSLDAAKKIIDQNRKFLYNICEAAGVSPCSTDGALSAQVLSILAHNSNYASFAGLSSFDRFEASLPDALKTSPLIPALVTAGADTIQSVPWQDSQNPYVIPKTMQGGTPQGPAPSNSVGLTGNAVGIVQDVINTLNNITQGAGQSSNPLQTIAGNAGTMALVETIKQNLGAILAGVLILLTLVYFTAKSAK